MTLLVDDQNYLTFSYGWGLIGNRLLYLLLDLFLDSFEVLRAGLLNIFACVWQKQPSLRWFNLNLRWQHLIFCFFLLFVFLLLFRLLTVACFLLFKHFILLVGLVEYTAHAFIGVQLSSPNLCLTYYLTFGVLIHKDGLNQIIIGRGSSLRA